MSKGLIAVLGFFGFVILVGIISVSTLFHFRSTAITLEEQVKAQHTANKSNYDNMWKSFKESAQVTDKQAEQFKSVYNDMISGRYENDSQVLMKMVQEQNPQLDASVYTKLQNQIIAGRKEFDNNQKKIADIIREYNTYVRKHFISNAIFRFETKNADDYIVTSEKTQKAFDSGKDDAIDLNSK